MRILLIHNFYQHRGGEDTVVEQEAELLSKNNTVKIITTNNKKGIKGLLQFLLYPFNIFEARRIKKEISAFHPDIVHVHNIHYALGPWIIRVIQKMGIPTVMTLHNFRIVCPSATLFFRDRLFTTSLTEDFPWTAVRNRVIDDSFIKTVITALVYWGHKKIGTWDKVDQFLVLSDFSKKLLTDSNLGLSASHFSVKPNFAAINRTYNKTFGDYFLYIGRLSSEKGILQLLHAISNTNHRLRIFGSGPLEKEVLQIVEQHQHIEYCGFQTAQTLQENIALASALIVPSICYEGMPMTLLESYAIGTPVLSSNIGILQEMVVPLYTGLHFDPYSSSSIQNTLDQWTKLRTDDKEVISRNCITTYKEKYTASKNIDLLQEIYHTAIHHKANQQ